MSPSNSLNIRHVVIVNNTSIYVHRFRREFIAALLESGRRVTLICPTDAASPKLADLGIEILPLDLAQHGTNPLGELRACFQLFRLLRRLRPDLVINFTLKPAIYGSFAARAAGVSHMSSVFTGLGYYFTGDVVPRSRPAQIIRFLLRLALPANQAVVFQNQDDRDLIVRYGLVTRERTHIVPGSGVNLSQFERCEMPANSEVFMLVGRMLVEKGVREFVQAATAVRARHPQVKFRLLGGIDGSSSAIPRAELDLWVTQGTVEYLGEVDDVRHYLAEASVIVLPSYREGLPRSLLEAMAIGRPIIATDVPGCRETVVEGINGYLVPARDPEALTHAMERMIGDPDRLRRMADASRALAEERFEVRAVSAKLLAAVGA